MAVADQPPAHVQLASEQWPQPDQLATLAPIVRLLSAIGAVPDVKKIGVTISNTGVDLWVFMAEENYKAEALISDAEREYLHSTQMLGFMLHVIPGDDVSPDVLPPYTVVFER